MTKIKLELTPVYFKRGSLYGRLLQFEWLSDEMSSSNKLEPLTKSPPLLHKKDLKDYSLEISFQTEEEIDSPLLFIEGILPFKLEPGGPRSEGIGEMNIFTWGPWSADTAAESGTYTFSTIIIFQESSANQEDGESPGKWFEMGNRNLALYKVDPELIVGVDEKPDGQQTARE